MCGITGWIDFNKDLRGSEEIIKGMNNKLRHRGPDESGLFSSCNVLFGHRRLVVVDPEGGQQPMTREYNKNRYTIVYNGELYNTEDLRKILLARGHNFKSYSDTEVLLTSYIEFGSECVNHLNGIFAFVVWDEKKKQIFMARDRMGVKPLFYYQSKNSLIFGSEIKALLAHPDLKPVIDEKGLMEIFGLGPARSPGSGVFKDIKELEPGYYLVFTKKGTITGRYWQLESKPHTDDFSTTVECVRNLFIDTVERQLVSDVPVCTFLSGGLDSSAISATAANHFQKTANQQLNTYSIDYRDNDLYFEKDEFQPNSDSVWLPEVVEKINSNHHYIYLDNKELVNALREAVIANDLPGMADIDSSLYLFTEEVKKQFTVALSGECADEIFGGYPWYRREKDIKADTFPWSKSIKERKNLLAGRLKKLPLESYVTAKYKKTLAEVPKFPGDNEREERMKELFYLNLKWFMVTLLTRKDRMSMANSLEVRVPFADHRLVEYSWNIPWEMKYYSNIEKGLLRKSFTGIVPDKIINRRKSPYPKTHHPEYTRAVQEWMRSILNDSRSPILEIVDLEVVRDLIESGGKSFAKPWFGQLMRGPQLLAYLIQVNLWLEIYNVQIEC